MLFCLTLYLSNRIILVKYLGHYCSFLPLLDHNWYGAKARELRGHPRSKSKSELVSEETRAQGQPPCSTPSYATGIQ